MCHLRYLLLAWLGLGLLGCPKTEPPPPEVGPVARVELSASRVLLTAARPEAALVARAFDATGREVTTASFTWATSDEAVVRVGADGALSAVGPSGSAVVTATAEGVSSAGALVLRATPAAGATLVDDAQLVGEPVAVDAESAYGPGWKWRVTLTGLEAPAPGALLVATGDLPVGGRVVTAAQGEAGLEVTLEVVALEALYDELVLKGVVPLEAPATTAQSGQPLRQALTQVGPFKCQSTIEPTLVQLSLPQSSFTPKLAFVVDYDRARPLGEQWREFRVEGSLDLDTTIALTLNAAVSGELECLAELVVLPIPALGVPGFGATVPVGVGLSTTLSSTLANVGGQLRVKGRVAVNEGFVCAAGADSCTTVHAQQAELDGALELVGAWPTTEYRYEVAMYGFGYANLAFGAWMKSLRFDALEVKAGLRASVDTATRARQVREPAYHSSITLSLHGEAEAAAAVQRFKDLLNVKFLSTTATVDVVLAQLPQGTFTAEPTQLEPGGSTHLVVELDAMTAETAGRVEVVRVAGTTLPVACSIPRSTPGQTRYACDVTLDTEGPQQFFAFVDTAADGSGVSLELDDHAPVTVQVGESLWSMKRVMLRLTPFDYTRTPTGTGCSGTQPYTGSSLFLEARDGGWAGTTFTASDLTEYPPGSFYGHARETTDVTLTTDATGSLVTAFDVRSVFIGYEDDAAGNWQREEAHLQWRGGSIPAVTPNFAVFDFQPSEPPSPSVLLLELTRTTSSSPCTWSVSTWSAHPTYGTLLIGFGR